MRKAALSAVILLLLACIAVAQRTQKASDILKSAQSKASDRNKTILLIFGASWCEACHQLDTFLALPDIAPIIDKYFVVAHLTFAEGVAGHPDWDTPGADSLIAKYGGVAPNGRVALPFIAIVDSKARLLSNSNPSSKPNSRGDSTGFPVEPDEIKAFLSMLQKGAPSLSPEELHKVEDGLHQAASD